MQRYIKNSIFPKIERVICTKQGGECINKWAKSRQMGLIFVVSLLHFLLGDGFIVDCFPCINHVGCNKWNYQRYPRHGGECKLA